MSRVKTQRLPVLGGAVCLDFVNTIDPRHEPPREEFLASYAALAEWAVFIGLISDTEAVVLLIASRSQPSEAADVHHRAIALREALYDLLRPSREKCADNELRACIDILNRELQRAMSEAELERVNGHFRLGWPARPELDRMLWPVVQSAATLLSSPDLSRVRECDGGGCGWLFLDTSKAGRRRWCSMAICGNRVKAQRHRARIKDETG